MTTPTPRCRHCGLPVERAASDLAVIDNDWIHADTGDGYRWYGCDLASGRDDLDSEFVAAPGIDTLPAPRPLREVIAPLVYDGSGGAVGSEAIADIADDIVEAVVEHLTDDAVLARFRAGWEQADADGDIGNRVRRGIRAMLNAERGPQS